MKPKFRNPAKLFLKDHHVNELSDVIEYTKFLLEESNLSDKPPIDLDKIHENFGIPYPQNAPLPKQQGLMIEIDGCPQILLRNGDPYVRQRFTRAHELIELLLNNQLEKSKFNGEKDTVFGNNKEKICQIGAAHILMPKNIFRPMALSFGISLTAGKKLAKLYEVSLTAALCRIVDQYPNAGAVIFWKLKNKPTEISKKIPKEQMTLPGFNVTTLPQKKLRVEWVYGKYKNLYIPKDKSISVDSSVFKCLTTNSETSGSEYLPFGSLNTSALIENKPIHIDSEKYVLSLIRDNFN